ncbi:glutathione peroxidase [Bdellovibrio sp. HCB337]|uniref:glutathione peroxidase n=1 Tax=Bdellovibrio sp. HCB337 TaxID=3394358 RepID=UPI0039A6EBEB
MIKTFLSAALFSTITLLFSSFVTISEAKPAASTLSSTHNFFEFSANDIRGKKVHFSQYRGKVVLVVNTASECGYTPQLKDLEALYKKYSAKGFTVLAFPSNDFKQEKATNDEVLSVAQKEYGVTFPIFDKGAVTGKEKQPVYKFMIEQKPGMIFKDVRWNFEKFLINRQGQVVDRWSSMTSPSSKSVIEKIEKALNDPI